MSSYRNNLPPPLFRFPWVRTPLPSARLAGCQRARTDRMMTVKMKYVWIVLIIVFVLMAPVTATNMVHSLVTFVQGVLSGFNLH